MAGEARMSCDRCVYRAPLPGFEYRVGQPQFSDAGHGLREGKGSGIHDHDIGYHRGF